MKPSVAERELVRAYRAKYITLEELWAKLGPGRSFAVCLFYGVPWDIRAWGFTLPVVPPEDGTTTDETPKVPEWWTDYWR